MKKQFIFSRLGICTTVHRGSDMHMKRQAGFTLVELAVVIFLIGLLASAGLSALNAQMASASISATKKKQEAIKDALISYLGKYKRLPCPATDATNGHESRVTTAVPANCTGYFGILPYYELGLPKNAALDGWENFFSYAISKQWTSTFDSTATPPANGDSKTNDVGQAFNVGDAGVIIVNDRSATSPEAPTPISSLPAVVFIVSHGKNGLGAFTSKFTQNVVPASGMDELFNAPDKTTWGATLPAAFYQREYTENASAYGTHGAFDDIVASLNANDLTVPLIKDGTLKSVAALEAQWAEQAANIKSAIVGYMFSPNNSGTCAPPASAAVTPVSSVTFAAVLSANNIPLTDPWGAPITYTNPQKICKLKKDPILKKTTTDCNSTVDYSTTSVAAYTIASPQGGTLNGPTYDQLIAGYQNLLQNCP